LAAALAEADYTESGISRVLHTEGISVSNSVAVLPNYEQRTEDRLGIGDFIRLFFLSIPLKAERLSPFLETDDLLYLGLASA
jgi:hypothetical protein